MIKYFVDTNIFVRYYLKDDAKLSSLAMEIVEGCVNGKYFLTICSTTFLELSWILGSYYKQPKNQIISFIEELFKIENLIVIDRNLTSKMLATYNSANIDMTDSYFSALMEQENIKEIFSFDRDFDKIKGIKRLEKW
ncbi:MAG: PIN domain-containing protein [bacterium]|nr:PIN domain-containing protein [bacterium]